MALSSPRNLPEAFWLPVVAAESQARLQLIQALGSHRFSEELTKIVVAYASAVSEAFAAQASKAARVSEFQLADLDSAVDKFVDAVLHHLYFDVNHPEILRNWPLGRGNSFGYELKPKVMLQPWHQSYLADVPKILASILKPELALSQISEKRRSCVQHRLEGLGLNVTGWAERAGVNPTVAYDYLNGKSTPRPDNRRALAEVIGLNPQDLP